MSAGELLNLIGLSTGVALYALLLVMVLRARQAPGARVDPLVLSTALLGLVWNLCALPIYAFPIASVVGPFPFLTVVGYGALGFLPAVVVHSVLRGDGPGALGRLNWSLAAVAYLLSATALALHVRAALENAPTPSVTGLRLLTYAFIALVAPLAVITRRQPGARRALWAAALSIFAVSALHLSQIHHGDHAWPVELLGHHASLPLAFAILYQDYPFALADLFLQRALSVVAATALVFGSTATLGAESPAFAQFLETPRQVGILITLWIGTVLVYPSLRRRLLRFIDAVMLGRPDYADLSVQIARRAMTHDDTTRLLGDVCALLAPAMSTRTVTWRKWRPSTDATRGWRSVEPGTDADALAPSVAMPAPPDAADDTTLTVTVPTSEPPRYMLVIGPLVGGRRLFSDDLAALEAIAVTVARRIDAIRLAAERYARKLRERETARLAAEADLRALRAQIHPHFLFNALTTLGHLIQTAPDRALETLMRLTTLLRGLLRSEGEYTTLGREIDLVEAYLDIERARFEERLAVSIDVPPALREARVPSLLLQPLVENAVKHGIANRQAGGEVSIRARAVPSAAGTDLVMVVRDTGAGTSTDAFAHGRRLGVGLQNVERRLAGHYGAAASLSIRTAPDKGTTVEIRLPAGPSLATRALAG